MTISLIVAMSDNAVIGRDNQLPWHLSEDLKQFKKITMGHPIIMGRKTFESIGKALPGRENIVVTRKPDFSAEGVTVCRDLTSLLKQHLSSEEEVFVIGGSELYEQALPHVRKLYITLIEDEFEGDAFFPDKNWKNNFEIVSNEGPFESAESGLDYRFIVAIPL